MSQLTCLRCKQPIDSQLEQCPSCGEKVTLFQRTYSTRLLDGKYQIIDRLGVGGMGEIFKVRHIHLNELRVIKIMRPNVAADDQGLQRFLQEARTSTMIKHKNLAMLYDFAQLEDSSYYMVWEFIDGTNIQKWIADNGPVPARLTVEIAIQALHGLDHLHSMGLIHRDISPENIMLSQDHHGKLAVKVIDFGIAKQLAEGEGGQGLTQTGMFLGKLKYASPEQAGFLKEDEHLDARSDLYSFGIVLYEMLAGRAPFHATNPHGYILKHVTEKPVAISEINPAIKAPPALEALILRALEKNRDTRFETALDFAQALESIRSMIPPEQKFGLGEKMVTLSGAKTLAELKLSGIGTMGGTAGTQQTQVGARSGNEATLVERAITPNTFAGATPTVVGNRPVGSNDATVIEKLGVNSAAPTVVEAKWGGDQAAATVIERKMDAPAAPKKNVAMIAAIAAVIVIALALGAYFMTRTTTPAPIAAATTPSGTDITATASPTTSPIPAGQGVLLLSASPWGNLDKIVNADNKQNVRLTEEDRSTPTRIELEPGNYLVTVSGPDRSETVTVQIEAGKRVRQRFNMGSVNLEELEKEVGKQ